MEGKENKCAEERREERRPRRSIFVNETVVGSAEERTTPVVGATPKITITIVATADFAQISLSMVSHFPHNTNRQTDMMSWLSSPFSLLLQAVLCTSLLDPGGSDYKDKGPLSSLSPLFHIYFSFHFVCSVPAPPSLLCHSMRAQ